MPILNSSSTLSTTLKREKRIGAIKKCSRYFVCDFNRSVICRVYHGVRLLDIVDRRLEMVVGL